jgi:hypothetical protein
MEPEVHYSVHISPLLVPTLSQMQPVHTSYPVSLRSILIISSHFYFSEISYRGSRVMAVWPLHLVLRKYQFLIPEDSHVTEIRTSIHKREAVTCFNVFNSSFIRTPIHMHKGVISLGKYLRCLRRKQYHESLEPLKVPFLISREDSF